VRIALLADWLNPCVFEAIEHLRRMVGVVDVVYPDRELTPVDAVRVQHDLYVLKSGTDAALSLAGVLHERGARTFNPYPVVERLRNKVFVMAALAEAGMPVPETYVAPRADDLVPLLDSGPLILKPFRGSRSEGVRVVRDPRQLRKTPFTGLMVAQRYYEPDGVLQDHKLYRIGERVFGVRRRWPLRTYADKLGEPFDPEPALRDLALRAGDVFGISLCGVDVVVSRGQAYLVDVNKFGSFMGVPEAPRLLAEHVLHAAAVPA
jgi:ribosomal protein S6--L-glutamate ligase